MAASAGNVGRKTTFVGNDKVLFGIIFGVLAFWLFAQTTLNIAPVMAEDLGLETSVMNIAVSITALFSGIFIVVMGGLADRLGRVRVLNWGFLLSAAGSILVGLAPTGALASTFLMLGRILQGLSAAAVMSASCWRCPSVLGRAGPTAGHQLVVHGVVGWVGLCSVVRRFDGGKRRLALDFFRLRGAVHSRHADGAGTPESKSETGGSGKFDMPGVITFMIMMVALRSVGDTRFPIGLGQPGRAGRPAVSIVFGILFFRIESRADNAFVNFNLFKNMTFTGATISNFMLNGTAGMLIVAMSLVQMGGGMTAQEAGILTLGYAISIVAFIRVGEKLLQHSVPLDDLGVRSSSAWLSSSLCPPTCCRWTRTRSSPSSVSPSSALVSGLLRHAVHRCGAVALPRSEAGSGSGIYKMARRWVPRSAWPSRRRCLRPSAATLRRCSGSRASSVHRPPGHTLAVRQAGFFALAANLLMVVGAIVSIMVTIPNSPRRRPSGPRKGGAASVRRGRAAGSTARGGARRRRL